MAHGPPPSPPPKPAEIGTGLFVGAGLCPARRSNGRSLADQALSHLVTGGSTGDRLARSTDVVHASDMKRKVVTARYTADEIAARLASGESRTDRARVDAMSRDEVERLADDEDGALPAGWESTVVLGLPSRKADIHIRLDGDVVDWFKDSGKGYQTRINAVLRAFVETRRRMAKPRRAERESSVKPASSVRIICRGGALPRSRSNRPYANVKKALANRGAVHT
jgi:uncharacterized protein (DUF4415 family)